MAMSFLWVKASAMCPGLTLSLLSHPWQIQAPGWLDLAILPRWGPRPPIAPAKPHLPWGCPSCSPAPCSQRQGSSRSWDPQSLPGGLPPGPAGLQGPTHWPTVQTGSGEAQQGGRCWASWGAGQSPAGCLGLGPPSCLPRGIPQPPSASGAALSAGCAASFGTWPFGS